MSESCQATLTCKGKYLPMLKGVKASGAIKGRLLLMTLEQRYLNTSPDNVEIAYTFPLPAGPDGAAVLMDVEVELNGKLLTGEVSAKAKARAQYEEALSEGNTSILLERNRDGSYTLELGNLLAGEECKIMIRYAQTLCPEHGQIRMMLPTTIAPRYGDPIAQGRMQPHQVPVSDALVEYPFDITVALLDDMAYSSVASPSHKTHFSRVGNDLFIKLAQRGFLDRDFILIISNLKSESMALVSRDFYREGQYAMMASFCPQIETAQEAQGLHAKILVDCSGSMAGDSIDAARRALAEFVQGLNKDDKISLSKFGDTVEHRSRGMWSGTAQARASAIRWIEGVTASMGGTEMAAALVSTIAIADTGRSDVLLVTDGEIEGIDEVIDVAEKAHHRIFVVAIGASPAEGHLRRLAAATGGYCDFVAPGEAVEPAIRRMFSRMRAARIRNLRVKWPNSLKSRWEQKVPSFAFKDDVLHVHAFFDGPEDVTDLKDLSSVKLWGQVGDSDNDVLLAVAPLSLTDSTTNVLARIGANARYNELICNPNQQTQTAQASARMDLAVTYRLITEETNYILVYERSDTERPTEMPHHHKVSQMLAAGWGASSSVIGGTSTMRKLRHSIVGASAQLQVLANSASLLDAVATPSVFRSARTQAAAKVDALSLGGMDDFEIPAFLRKMSDFDDDIPFSNKASTASRVGIDKSNPLYWVTDRPTAGRLGAKEPQMHFVGITPAGLVKWLQLNDSSFWPSTYAALRDLGLCLSICEWLEFEVGQKLQEKAVVSAFLQVMQGMVFAVDKSVLSGTQDSGGGLRLVKEQSPASELEVEIRQALANVGAQAWPIAIVNFPEECC